MSASLRRPSRDAPCTRRFRSPREDIDVFVSNRWMLENSTDPHRDSWAIGLRPIASVLTNQSREGTLLLCLMYPEFTLRKTDSTSSCPPDDAQMQTLMHVALGDARFTQAACCTFTPRFPPA